MRREPVVHSEESRNNHQQLPWAHLRLPPFPQVALRVLQLVRSEHVPLHVLADLIGSDPAFASELLTVANSALYAPRFPASGILQAIAVLGANHLQGMCIAVGARAYLGRSLRYPALRRVWQHNLACAVIARELAAATTVDADDAYTAGILHDVGRFALASLQTVEYAHLLDQHQGNSASLLDEERRLFGWDHCEAGQRLIAGWSLPAEFDAVTRDHHSAPCGPEQWDLGRLIHASCRLADALGFTAFAGCAAEPVAEILGGLPETQEGRALWDADALSRAVSHCIHTLECA